MSATKFCFLILFFSFSVKADPLSSLSKETLLILKHDIEISKDVPSVEITGVKSSANHCTVFPPVNQPEFFLPKGKLLKIESFEVLEDKKSTDKVTIGYKKGDSWFDSFEHDQWYRWKWTVLVVTPIDSSSSFRMECAENYWRRTVQDLKDFDGYWEHVGSKKGDDYVWVNTRPIYEYIEVNSSTEFTTYGLTDIFDLISE